MDNAIKSQIESAVGNAVTVVSGNLPPALASQAATLQAAGAAYARFALQYYAAHAIAEAQPGLANALKAAYPAFGL